MLAGCLGAVSLLGLPLSRWSRLRRDSRSLHMGVRRERFFRLGRRGRSVTDRRVRSFAQGGDNRAKPVYSMGQC